MRTVKAQVRLGDVQADLSLRWALVSFCWFCHVAVHMFFFSVFFISVWWVKFEIKMRFHRGPEYFYFLVLGRAYLIYKNKSAFTQF